MKRLIEALKKEGVVNRGDFILTSGKSSNYYFDMKKVAGNPQLFSYIASLLSDKIKGKATCVASIGFGGVPLATAVSLKLNLPLIMVRDGVRAHGLGKIIEGYAPNKNDKVAVVDDVCTYGTSLKKIIRQINKTSAKVSGCYVVVTRSDKKLSVGAPIYHLVKADEIID
ncbi:MAG: orotate phosphoribosyltransferase [Candidatus Yanofskybacteria bacterium RIFCSPLOWO2_02_FULL_43_10]|uniref:Orotate phosphoribosyltransferase n=1 Tax=Candidatus Yanofskybacteria bacterium RIFCSPLOWO2_12_FULL_43_11b TaxID=1802710 RepID=A0A1F8HBG6_9BACT|nr:MAG: orotate phosphoribosyltransferase [Candidatus Yanofskybacteria bacterium RIFCSPHIGHO2_01_FULL_43_32]OGN11456.1 MAG: orotate phosphoribosyltransferase [Candidatus Yanofskybacteria bacterium RIFCSPHIGHO2_02_FULL_43_12]OGN17481.1 MAG: orotate phosphoribosyltransferase [Candidatus Yanofskybacteria bacterium RIFCSPHIGHO2_12_FULL_43_11]OGN24935.1 MAG: orotate phosphoribosyltransferase [Candidatus Yanofskybacteria bacterium RIFCSPLOWO2_01_FULL_43_46]OGN30699.1 MAG: orotate phosphoribosyltransf